MVAISMIQFTTVRSEGNLLPPDILRRITDPQDTLEGRSTSDYHLSGELLNEAINNAWNCVRSAWRHFTEAQDLLPETEIGTTITRERWLLPLFMALDYGRLQTSTAVNIDGRSYPISHRWGNLPVHLVSFRVGLDEKVAGVAGAATSSPHSLMQMFLNRSEEHLWGIVSNGDCLRVLRDNSSFTRQAYIEFDLRGMMEGEAYTDFVLLWMICHFSRVEGGNPHEFWLEKWARTSEEQGTRALESLQGSVKRAIEALGTGFVKHPRNHALREKLQSGQMSKQDYYRQILRLVYRFLFLFVAEDRELLLDPNAQNSARDIYLEHYSVQRLRQVAEHFRGTVHPDQFEGLRLVMRLVGGYDNGKATILALPILGSFLFDDDFVRDVIDCTIANRDLLEAIRSMAFIEDKWAGTLRPIDYKHLGPEELGSIYESLLEFQPNVNITEGNFALKSLRDGSERQETASFFTPSIGRFASPPVLINALLDSALEPVLARAIKSRDPENAILNLKICDPACGSGSFLIAAAHRMARSLARIRTGEDEPSPSHNRTALRDVIGHCIYGVDINPMTVELCKVNLWIEALDPGKPLSFLDHHIKVGNSLLGTTPALMTKGIPNEAFIILEGDDNDLTNLFRIQNRKERRDFEKGQRSMFELVVPPPHATFRSMLQAVDSIDDKLISGVRAKAERWHEVTNDSKYINARRLADAWCAAFVWERRAGKSPNLLLTQLTYQRLCENVTSKEFDALHDYVEQLRKQYGFFHWHLEFPEVFQVPEDLGDADNSETGWSGGFDVVLSNPPWDKVELLEQEWFATSYPEIAKTSGVKRKSLIAELEQNDPIAFQNYAIALRMIDAQRHFFQKSGLYPFCGRGRINTYAVFTELNRALVNTKGLIGCIVPSGIATDDTTKLFFQSIVSTKTLFSLFDFENKNGLFPAIHREQRFSLLTIGGAKHQQTAAEFLFYGHKIYDLQDKEKRFRLEATDLLLLNPNTQTAATFRNRHDAVITTKIYRTIPILIQENEPSQNLWQASFKQGIFNLTSDSGLFLDAEQLFTMGYQLEANNFTKSEGIIYLPLYEGKLTQIYDHRATTFEGLHRDEILKGNSRAVSEIEHKNPRELVLARSWVSQIDFNKAVSDYADGSYWLTFHDVANPNNERTFIATFCPFLPLGNTLPIILSDIENISLLTLCANLNAFLFDYVSRLKISSRHFNFFIVKQLPVVPPHTYTPNFLDFIIPRVLELTYTAWDMQVFAQDAGYLGAPFLWDEERRFLIRCELDALYFHLYQIERNDVNYIMETFPIVKRKDEAQYGEYRTKRIILEMYDQMTALPKISVPAPKDASTNYDGPDVSKWQTWLTPAPADQSVAHKE